MQFAMHCALGGRTARARASARILCTRSLSTTPRIAVHGGAWAIPDNLLESSAAGVKQAADVGYDTLINSGSALDAVEAAVRTLEADPSFDAGRGAVLNAAGGVELDAVIMDGKTLEAGSVAGLGPILHPVSVARLVMEKSDHVLLVGAGADAFAKEHGIPSVPVEELVTQAARDEYNAMAAYPVATHELFNKRATGGGGKKATSLGHDTVGAVAIDAAGNLAAATSTGGITFKRVGRVGDSPIIGSGVLADNELGAISTTGHGEAILKFTLASRIAQRMAMYSGPEAAVTSALTVMARRLGGCGGAICLSPQGGLGIAFTTERMAWAMRDGSSNGSKGGVQDNKSVASGGEALGNEGVQVIEWWRE